MQSLLGQIVDAGQDVDPQAWLADTLARIHDHPAKAIADLLPWNWKAKA